MKTDPTDTGGLFIGRRPGTRPDQVPRRARAIAAAARQRSTGWSRSALLGLMIFVNLLFWGPLPVAWLWVGSQVDYVSGSTFLGITVAFFGLLLTLILGLVVSGASTDVDPRPAGRRLRPARGHDRPGLRGLRVIGATIFIVWFISSRARGSSLGPAQ